MYRNKSSSVVVNFTLTGSSAIAASPPSRLGANAAGNACVLQDRRHVAYRRLHGSEAQQHHFSVGARPVAMSREAPGGLSESSLSRVHPAVPHSHLPARRSEAILAAPG